MRLFLFSLVLAILSSCNSPTKHSESRSDEALLNIDPHSFGDDSPARMDRLKLSLVVDFEQKKISGSAEANILHHGADSVFFDTKELQIDSIWVNGQKVDFLLDKEQIYVGSKLGVKIDPNLATSSVRIFYKTSPSAEALQWLDASQTSYKHFPFLYTQGQAILTRTWIPIQDSPGIRMTYEADIAVPKEYLALMSATNPKAKNATGQYHFEMNRPIPAYLIALAVGDLRYKAFDAMSGVYAEPNLIDQAVKEFSETPAMIKAAESLYGPYVWGQYDILVLPSAFPYGGMENPMLTFATPTILAGDKSLSSLIAHELAHSWSGNLVTNATWNDFWLNEGFTVYFERRILEQVKSIDFAQMSAMIGEGDLNKTMKDFGDTNALTKLKLNLKGMDPDEGTTDIAYEKGAAFLTLLENTFGRAKMDTFLVKYFDIHKFKSITTEGFKKYLYEVFPAKQLDSIHTDQWLYQPGLPDNMPKYSNFLFQKVDSLTNDVLSGKQNVRSDQWAFNQWLQFIRNIDGKASITQLNALDQKYHFSKSGNFEILAAWYEVNIKAGNKAVNPGVANFLNVVGRRKFLVPLYTALVQTGQKDVAQSIYKKSRQNYHSVSRSTIDDLLK